MLLTDCLLFAFVVVCHFFQFVGAIFCGSFKAVPKFGELFLILFALLFLFQFHLPLELCKILFHFLELEFRLTELHSESFSFVLGVALLERRLGIGGKLMTDVSWDGNSCCL